MFFDCTRPVLVAMQISLFGLYVDTAYLFNNLSIMSH